LRALVPKFWAAAISNKCCGTEVLNAYIYFKRKFNSRRNRWELEFITITPNNHFQTEKFKFAVKVKL